MIHELVEVQSAEGPEKQAVRNAVAIFSEEARKANGHVWTVITVGDGRYAVCEVVFRSVEEWDAFRKEQKLRKKRGENAMAWREPSAKQCYRKRTRNGYSKRKGEAE